MCHIYFFSLVFVFLVAFIVTLATDIHIYFNDNHTNFDTDVGISLPRRYKATVMTNVYIFVYSTIYSSNSY